MTVTDDAQVGLGPVPTDIAVHAVTLSNGNAAVVLELVTPLGPQSYFFIPDAAERIARELVEKAATARTGLVIATNGAHP